ncbi:hypothetical protein A4H97_16155 [Niastella yeongjuensis]|uniref:Uncharacterized protein n=1 Tax=Niastella yeongjuensis TaxID=354355 RepID=A0A1V9E0V1_9BACT|nr:hypothetical protein [Niastella yeongjuensis]OQP39757.1 hypothetical protein A4H97_16155 [Niastella yeongjuensis]SEO04315.1 hypothetical protein SAMN05660816_01978 [Niastella yeongjuensis]
MKHIAWCLLLLCQCALGQDNKSDDIISGNPYLFKDWCDGVVRFSSGRTLNQFKLKFDCLKNALLLQFNGSAFAAQSKVQEFVMYPKKKDSLLFRLGYPVTDKTSENTFFQVLVQDKATLLRLIARTIIEEKQVVATGRAERRMEAAEYYYLLQNGTMTLLPDDRTELPTRFADKKEPIAAFISEQQLKMHTPEDFVLVVKKYNELLSTANQ